MDFPYLWSKFGCNLHNWNLQRKTYNGRVHLFTKSFLTSFYKSIGTTLVIENLFKGFLRIHWLLRHTLDLDVRSNIFEIIWIITEIHSLISFLIIFNSAIYSMRASKLPSLADLFISFSWVHRTISFFMLRCFTNPFKSPFLFLITS